MRLGASRRGSGAGKAGLRLEHRLQRLQVAVVEVHRGARVEDHAAERHVDRPGARGRWPRGRRGTSQWAPWGGALAPPFPIISGRMGAYFFICVNYI